MNKTTRFMVEIITTETITDDKCKDEIAQNIANGIVHWANNGDGITPDYADAAVDIVYVKEWYSDTQIIEHIN